MKAQLRPSDLSTPCPRRNLRLCVSSLTRTLPPHASVNISLYKRDSICAKVAHIAYEPISAEIYVLAAFSDPADIYAGALLAIQPTYIFLCFMRSTRHILFVAVSVPADIYYPPLQAYWLNW